MLPDVSANANVTSYECANQTGCAANSLGATRFAAPMWAGFPALVNEQIAASGGSPVGFINPAIHAQNLTAGYAAEFHDITSGTSGSSFAVVGDDLVTGWGTPAGQPWIDFLGGGAGPRSAAEASRAAQGAQNDI